MFQTIGQRYERQGAMIVTSNKVFAAGGKIFAGDAVMASAAVDRLLHRCTVVNIRGEFSFEREEVFDTYVEPEHRFACPRASLTGSVHGSNQ